MTNGEPAQKKGLSTLAWIAIGCGGLIVVGLIAILVVREMRENPAKTAAETMVRMNPDLEIVSTDDEAGTVILRNSRTGERVTLDLEDSAEGRFSITTDKGETRIDSAGGEAGSITIPGPDGGESRFGASADLDQVPEWVPLYPNAGSTLSLYAAQAAQTISGRVMSKTGDSAQDVIDHYTRHFNDEGYEIGATSMAPTAAGAPAWVIGELEGRTIRVDAMWRDGECQVLINYNAKS